MTYSLLALLPILVLVILSLWKNLNIAVTISFLVTSGLFFLWQVPLNHYFASLLTALFSSITILMIVFGAMFLYRVMEGTGYIRDISDSMRQIHPAKEIRFFLIAIGLTAFFEGVAGFGTPGSIVPLLLIALGFDAILSVAVVLLLDSLVAVAGAVGTPVLTGLQLPLELSPETVAAIYAQSAVLISLAGLLVLLFIMRLYRKSEGEVRYPKPILLMYAFFALPLIIFSRLAGEFSIILAAVSMLGLSAVVLKKGEEPISWRPWLPYLFLIALLLLPKLISPLQQLISWEWRLHNVFSTGWARSSPAVPPFPIWCLGRPSPRRPATWLWMKA